MPIVFIHGVATRYDPNDPPKEVANRDALLRRLVLGTVAKNAAAVTIANPYWGSDGADPAWGGASLPRGEFEALAMGDPDAAAIHAIAVAAEASDTLHDNLLVDVARRSLPAAVDVLWEVATTVTDASRSDDLAALAAQAIAYAEAYPRPAWVDAVNDTDEFVARLETEVTQWTSDAASGGGIPRGRPMTMTSRISASETCGTGSERLAAASKVQLGTMSPRFR